MKAAVYCSENLIRMKFKKCYARIKNVDLFKNLQNHGYFFEIAEYDFSGGRLYF